MTMKWWRWSKQFNANVDIHTHTPVHPIVPIEFPARWENRLMAHNLISIYDNWKIDDRIHRFELELQQNLSSDFYLIIHAGPRMKNICWTRFLIFH